MYLWVSLFYLIITSIFLFWILKSIHKGRYRYIDGTTHANRAQRRADKVYMKNRGH